MNNVANALIQSYALILIMANETHSRRVTLAWERAKRALESAGAPDFGTVPPVKH